MNRPPRKKKPVGAASDSHPHATDTEAAAASQDDRNLVNIDEAFKEADVEDRVWLFWQHNKRSLIGGSILAIVAVLGVEGYRYYQAQAELTLQADYQAANSAESLQSFGEAHAAKPLGGFALLEAADDKYAAGDFAAAATLYGQSATGLTGTPFYGRALLGQGMALIKAEDTVAGTAKLNLLVEDPKALEATRAEAAFDLALLALTANDFVEANRWIQKIEGMSTQTIWGQQAQMLVSNTPELEALNKTDAAGESTINVEEAPKAALPATSDEAPSAETDAETALNQVPETGIGEEAE